MKHVMLDVDGTLIQSYELDERCFIAAVLEATGLLINQDWANYPHVTDRGILMQFIETQAPHLSLVELEPLVKSIFIGNIKSALRREAAQEVLGAKTFVDSLLNNPQYVVSIATGGWGETAKLKLESAGFDTAKLNISSSNDHYSRVEIMKLANTKEGKKLDLPVTYFGDAQWDLQACAELDMNLVIVGSRVSHHQRIPDFSRPRQALSYLY
ncbi:HAD family hydrolase [Alginatibacterium sediminis]|uniref:HAD family hydrolase n=1 Tax=Alginatibacterium sediminis TaxID=2164068 RepID=A0A420EBL2_9ALTE|nr:HAD family hydrolase [Alginatibacterium sediminis]RKF18079.1 HAD family hydrolase [Alginatibacterium sediminis]